MSTYIAADSRETPVSGFPVDFSQQPWTWEDWRKSYTAFSSSQLCPCYLLSLQGLHWWEHVALEASTGCSPVYLFPNACRPRPEQRSSGHTATYSPSQYQMWDQFLLQTRRENKYVMNSKTMQRGRRNESTEEKEIKALQVCTWVAGSHKKSGR